MRNFTSLDGRELNARRWAPELAADQARYAGFQNWLTQQRGLLDNTLLLVDVDESVRLVVLGDAS